VLAAGLLTRFRDGRGFGSFLRALPQRTTLIPLSTRICTTHRVRDTRSHKEPKRRATRFFHGTAWTNALRLNVHGEKKEKKMGHRNLFCRGQVFSHANFVPGGYKSGRAQSRAFQLCGKAMLYRVASARRARACVFVRPIVDDKLWSGGRRRNDAETRYHLNFGRWMSPKHMMRDHPSSY